MIRYARPEDIDILVQNDTHVDKAEMLNLINLDRVYIMEDDGRFIGWLRYNLFWDHIPFMNMICLNDSERGKGYASRLIRAVCAAEAARHNSVQLFCDPSLEPFYSKLGFAVIGKAAELTI